MSGQDAKLGDCTLRTKCRFCEGGNLTTILDLGHVPLAGGFLKPDEVEQERFFPLQLAFCLDCALVQVVNVVPATELFSQYYYFSSAIGTLVEHFDRLAGEVADELLDDREGLVVEIGCNDGVMLKPLARRKVRCLGVDPASNVVATIDDPGIDIVNDFFGRDVATRIRDEHGQAKVIASSYSLAHIDDMVDIIEGVRHLLAPDGAFVFEVYYLPELVSGLQYDMVYHEHCSYYSLIAVERFLERFGMEVYDVGWIPEIRGGTMRFYCRHRGGRPGPISARVDEARAREQAMGVDRLDAFQQFARRVEESRDQLLEILDGFKREGQHIIGYGASGRATTLSNYCGIGSQYLDYVVDDAPAKHGLLTPGTHLLIRPWEAVHEPPSPTSAVVFAWSFIAEVMKKRQEFLQGGGRFIVPLPSAKVVTG